MTIETEKLSEAQISRDNAGRFLPGQSGNPYGSDGRPVGSVSLVRLLRKRLAEHPEDSDAIIDALVKKGQLGSVIATREMMDRIDGKVPETHRIEGELPIRIEFVPASALLRQPAIEGEARELLEGDNATE